MKLLLNNKKKNLFKKEFLFKDEKNNIIYKAKMSLLTLYNTINIYEKNKIVATIKKNIFSFPFPKYRVKTILDDKFYLAGKENYLYKILDKNWYITGNINEFHHTIITLNNVFVAEMSEEVGVQPNYNIEITEEKDVIPAICTILCIYFSKENFARNS